MEGLGNRISGWGPPLDIFSGQVDRPEGRPANGPGHWSVRRAGEAAGQMGWVSLSPVWGGQVGPGGLVTSWPEVYCTNVY